jgi:hypothetical protein
MSFRALSTDLIALRIRDILVWIQIRGSVPLTNGSWSGSGSWACYFRQWSSRWQQQQKNVSKFFFAFLKVHLYHFSKIKVVKKSQTRRNQVFLSIFALKDPEPDPYLWLTDRDTGRPKSRRIRIRNTGIWVRAFCRTNRKPRSWSNFDPTPSISYKFGKRLPAT